MFLSDPSTLLACVIAVFLVGIAKGGFSGVGALATPVLALALPPTTAAGLLLPLLIVQDALSVWAFRRDWDRWVAAWMLPGMVQGVGIGWAFAATVDEKAVLAVLGLLTLAFGLYRLWLGRGGRITAASTSPGWVGTLFGIGSGFASQIAHAGGPPFQMWVTPRNLPHLTFVGTSAITFAVMNWVKVPSYIALGVFTHEVLIAAALLMPLALLSTWFGIWLLKRLNPARFYTIIYWLMVLLGAKLAWDGIA